MTQSFTAGECFDSVAQSLTMKHGGLLQAQLFALWLKSHPSSSYLKRKHFSTCLKPIFHSITVCCFLQQLNAFRSSRKSRHWKINERKVKCYQNVVAGNLEWQACNKICIKIWIIGLVSKLNWWPFRPLSFRWTFIAGFCPLFWDQFSTV